MVNYVVIKNCTYTTMQKTPFAIGRWARQYGSEHDQVNVIWKSRNCCVVYSNDTNKMTIVIHDSQLEEK